jgi:hypothetical protein
LDIREDNVIRACFEDCYRFVGVASLDRVKSGNRAFL